MITIYTDGACQKTRGGWSYVVEDGSRKGSGFEIGSTNNRMEMMGAIKALEAYPMVDVQIVSDSQYLVKGMTDYIRGWKQNGWFTSGGLPVKNKDLWLRLENLVLGRKVTFTWVKGHAHDPLNVEADRLAQMQASDGEKGGFKATHIHIKSGRLYRMVRDKAVKLEADWEDAAVYENAEGLWIVRNKAEFAERFQKVKRSP